MSLWDEFLGFEERTKDPNRFKTRGYYSLEEEKLRKQFNTQFPKLEEEIVKVDEYEELNQVKFAIYGHAWCEYIKQIKQTYQDREANEKREIFI
jgi:predicted NodU family carbamoyl transferase